MKKIFISVPMKGKTKEEIKRMINNMEYKAILELGYDIEFINTIVQDKPPYKTNNEAIWYLGTSIKLLSQCQVLVCLKELDNKYNGCIIEKEIAKRYGLQIIEL